MSWIAVMNVMLKYDKDHSQFVGFSTLVWFINPSLNLECILVTSDQKNAPIQPSLRLMRSGIYRPHSLLIQGYYELDQRAFQLLSMVALRPPNMA